MHLAQRQGENTEEYKENQEYSCVALPTSGAKQDAICVRKKIKTTMNKSVYKPMPVDIGRLRALTIVRDETNGTVTDKISILLSRRKEGS